MLVIGGQDLTLKMDLVEQVRPFSAMPIDTRIQVILGGYGALGIVPSVVPPPIVETPIPTERIPNQVGTDYASPSSGRFAPCSSSTRTCGKRLGRPRKTPAVVAVPGGSVRAAAAIWGVSKSTAARWISEGRVPTCGRDYLGA
jgi:hypothetical protein